MPDLEAVYAEIDNFLSKLNSGELHSLHYGFDDNLDEATKKLAMQIIKDNNLIIEYKPGNPDSTVTISTSGINVIENGGIRVMLGVIKKKEKRQEALQWYQTEAAERQYNDYGRTRVIAEAADKRGRTTLCIAKIAIGISITTLVITVITILLSRCKVWPFDK